MSYYDDLGLTPDASPDEIRESYRTLVRLLHPDQQTDPALKNAAEGQMRRINKSHAVLSDQGLRRRYDAELNAPSERPAPIVIRAPVPIRRRRIPFGTLAWIGAAVTSFATIYWLSSQGQLTAVRPETAGYPVVNPAAPAGARAAASVPPTIPVANTPTPTPNRLAGFWVYSHTKQPNPDQTLYPPEFIEASIVGRDGGIHGKYRARYHISDRSISPDVNFEFDGTPGAPLAKFPWRGEGGSRGQVRIKMLSDNEIEVAWSATELGQSLALVSGTDVLIRRPD